MATYPPLKVRDLPQPLPWQKALGVGVVMMGLAIGTGELILWPHLVVKHGLNLLWFALAGITCQFFINQEVARHAIATGESFFTTSARWFKWTAPFWFISAILLYIWPGWASAIGTTLKELFGFGDYLHWAWVTLALVLVLTWSGKVAYKVLETTLKVVVPTFFILLLVVSFFNLSGADLAAAWQDFSNVEGLLDGVDLNVLLGAIVFAGAGGMLNLCLSLWYRDKHLGMGQYFGQITNPITGHRQSQTATGYTFLETRENLRRWRGWFRYVLVDQGLIFWLLGVITLGLLSVNAFVVLSPRGLVPDGLNIAVVQAHIFGEQWGIWGYNLFLVMAFLMLFSVMWTVLDALTRILSDIIYTNTQVGPFSKALVRLRRLTSSQLYYITIGVVVLFGAALIPWQQPLVLLTTSAVLGGLSMAIYTPLLIYFNNTKLPRSIRPGIFTNIIMFLTALFFIFFALSAILNILPRH